MSRAVSFPLTGTYSYIAGVSSAGGAASVGVALDSTTSPSGVQSQCGEAAMSYATGSDIWLPQLGVRFIKGLEYGGTGVTFYGGSQALLSVGLDM
jgi:hypothetical protein